MPLPPTPRQQQTTRAHDDEVDADHETKRAKVESQKKQKIAQLKQQHESLMRVVKIGDAEFATMDSYDNELSADDDTEDEDEFWSDEDKLQFTIVPEALCGPALHWTNDRLLLSCGWTSWQMRLKSTGF
eukprot:s2013_g16.t1